MGRITATVKDINAETNVTSSNTTIDASLVTAGLDVTDFFDTKEGDRAILVTNTSTVTSDTITIKAGTGVSSDLGNMVVDIAQNEQMLIGGLDSARFDQGDGSLYVDFYYGTTGTIMALGEKRTLV